MLRLWQFWALAAILAGTAAGKRARRSSGAGPGINLIEDPNQIRPRVQVHIAGVSDPVTGFIDSGASRSVVSRDLAVKIGAVDLCRGRKSLRTLGGCLVPILGNVGLNVSYQRREVALVDVPVVEEAAHSLILGQDWMASVGEVRIAYHEGVGFQVNLGGVEGPINLEDDGKRAWVQERANDSMEGEQSERRQPMSVPPERKDETSEALENAIKPLGAECCEPKCGDESAYLFESVVVDRRPRVKRRFLAQESQLRRFARRRSERWRSERRKT